MDDCLYRLKRLEIVVTRPFLMEVLRLNQDGKLTSKDVLQIFLITENYLFRRNICEVPTNALNKIFLTLNREILRFDNTADNYVAKFIYSLLSKKESGRFPDDAEFTDALATKQVYQMRGKYKAYLFERFENYGTIETKDVYTHLDNNIYTIEHIMPQHLTPAWIECLGANAADIHGVWLHRLANLTLTGYNPNLSNKSFAEKRDAKEGGYKASGLKMNQKIATQNSWSLVELEARNAEMLALAVEIWAYPSTDFVPAAKEFDSCTLDDENAELTGRDTHHKWKKCKLGLCCSKIGSGKTPRGGSSVYVDQGVMFLRSQNVLWGNLDISDVSYIDDETNKTMLSSEVHSGDVLLNITGASIGRSCIYSLNDRANVNQHVCILRLSKEGKEKLFPEFLLQQILSDRIQQQVMDCQNGGSRCWPSMMWYSILLPFGTTADTMLPKK